MDTAMSASMTNTVSGPTTNTKLLAWVGLWFALDDLQRGYPDRAAFATAVKALTAQIALAVWI